ncbi:MAG: SRPBCC domain-containing protein [Rhodothermales bacterium]|nr:SRPBCC domain-containing protein [Rhodothermales bacterium]
MDVKTKNSIQLSRVINASQRVVFDAWTQPEKLSEWSCPEGATVEIADVDLTVGGRYRIRMKTGEDQYHTAIGAYREIDAPNRLVYTWAWEEIPDAYQSLVTVTFNSLGDSTEVVILHERFPDEKTATDHEMGWTSCLDKLEGLFA